MFLLYYKYEKHCAIPQLELVWLRYLVSIVAFLIIGFVTKSKKRDRLG